MLWESVEECLEETSAVREEHQSLIVTCGIRIWRDELSCGNDDIMDVFDIMVYDDACIVH